MANATYEQSAELSPPRSWLNAWTAFGGLAGLGALVFLLGGAIEAIRLHAAHLPVVPAITVVPKDTLFALAMSVLILPLVLAAVALILVLFLVSEIRNWLTSARREDSHDDEHACGRAEMDVELRARGSAKPDLGRRAVRAFVSGRYGPFGEYTAVWVPGVVLVELILLPLPVSFLITVPMIYIVQAPIQVKIMTAREGGEISRRLEMALLGAVVFAVAGTASLVGEVVHPGPLPRVAVVVSGHSRPMTGAFVAETSDAMYVGSGDQLMTIPMRLVHQVTVKAAPSKPEKVESLIGRLG